MRIFHIQSGGVTELSALPTQMPEQGFVWIACSRPAFQSQLAEIQACLQTFSLLLQEWRLLVNHHAPWQFQIGFKEQLTDTLT